MSKCKIFMDFYVIALCLAMMYCKTEKLNKTHFKEELYPGSPFNEQAMLCTGLGLIL